MEGFYNYTSACTATLLGGGSLGETIKFLDWAIAHQPGRKQPASLASLRRAAEHTIICSLLFFRMAAPTRSCLLASLVPF